MIKNYLLTETNADSDNALIGVLGYVTKTNDLDCKFQTMLTEHFDISSNEINFDKLLNIYDELKPFEIPVMIGNQKINVRFERGFIY